VRDYTRLAVEENGHGGGNDELHYYLDRTENVRVENGYLILEAHKEHFDYAGTVRDYSSGRIHSKRRTSWTYGRFEVRVQLRQGCGLWPAAWLLPEDHRIVTRARPLM
jgi:beta-glucanase (GH16 family)